MSPIATDVTCKCCRGQSAICGVVDFSRGGADYLAGKKVDPYAGVPIYYYRCNSCAFVFTVAFDDWSAAQFSEHIYNADYVRQDPDYTFARPNANAQMIADHFPALAHLDLLDYGSGSGVLAKELESRGFPKTRSYDPFSGTRETDTLESRYDAIFAFEVFEHDVNPLDLMRKLSLLLNGGGAVLLSTLFVPDELATRIEQWWYCMPRNGHVSFFTPASLAIIASAVGLNTASFNDGLHLLYRATVPDWASS